MQIKKTKKTYEIVCHSVDISCDFLPSPFEASDIGLAAHDAVDTYVLGDSLHIVAEYRQPVNHVVVGLLEDEYLSLGFDVDLLAHISVRDGLGDSRDGSDLGCEVRGHGVDVLREVLPFALDIVDLGLAAEGAIRADLSSHLADFEGEGPETVHHGVDGVLEIENLAAHFDSDLLGEVALGDGSRHQGDTTHLRRQIHGHVVDVLREVPPGALDVVHGSLAAQATLGSDFPRNLGDLASELLELGHHGIDRLLQLENLSSALGLHLLGEITLGDGRGHVDNVSHLRGQVVGHGVDVHRQLVPHSLDTHDVGLATQYALGSDIAGDTSDFGCECPQLIHHCVDRLLELQNLTSGRPLDLLGQISVGDGRGHGCDFAHYAALVVSTLASSLHLVCFGETGSCLDR